MKTHLTHSLLLMIALMSPYGAYAGPLTGADHGDRRPLFTQVEVDCFAVGQDKAAELGGELAKATLDTADGVPVCKLVVLVPGKDGGRPQRVAIDVPQ